MNRALLFGRLLTTYVNPIPPLFHRAGLRRPGSRVVRLRNGLRFAVRGDSSDFPILNEVYVHRVYDSALANIRRGSMVLDIGGQCGAFTLDAARRGARVVAFEPLEENREALAVNASLNGLGDRVYVRPYAVSATPGRAEFHTMEGDTGGGTLFPSIHPEWTAQPNVRVTSVEVVSFEEALGEAGSRVDLVKMDCEGAEYDIVLRSPDDVLRRAAAYVVEHHPNGEPQDLVRRFEELGYDVRPVPGYCVLYAKARSTS